MWQLICDHRYEWADIAADRSPWGSNGISSNVTPLADVRALRFSSPASQVAIPRRPSDPWSSLDAIAVEVIARFVAQASGTLIDADGSFRVRVDNGVLTGEAAGRQIPSGGVIPADRWVQVTFYHGGFNSIGAGYSTLGPGAGSTGGGGTRIPYGLVPPVGPKGILIGNRIGSSAQYMRGDIASVQVWRRDPAAMAKQFLGRPLDHALAACWTEFLRKLREALRDNPKCAEWIVQLISSMRRNLLEKLAQKSADKIAEFEEMCRQYRDLWFGGHIDSPQMHALFVRMRDWLSAEGLLPEPGMFDHRCLATLTDALPSLGCDPQFMRLIELLLSPRAAGAA